MPKLDGRDLRARCRTEPLLDIHLLNDGLVVDDSVVIGACHKLHALGDEGRDAVVKRYTGVGRGTAWT